MEGFVKRLEKLLRYYNINASSFADKIGVQRSSLSHLLSGRNKPSLDFIIKIIEEFPDVDLYWILQGKGVFPKKNEPIDSIIKQKNDVVIEENLSSKKLLQNKQSNPNLFDSIITDKENVKESSYNDEYPIQKANTIQKIVIFYNDGTFEDFKPK